MWSVEYHKLEQNPMKDIQDLKSADEDNEKIMWLTEEEYGGKETNCYRPRRKEKGMVYPPFPTVLHIICEVNPTLQKVFRKKGAL